MDSAFQNCGGDFQTKNVKVSVDKVKTKNTDEKGKPDKDKPDKLSNNLGAEKDKTSFKLEADSEKTDKMTFELEADSEKTDKTSFDLVAEIKKLDNALRMSTHGLIDSVVFPNFWRFPGTYFAKVLKNIFKIFD